MIKDDENNLNLYLNEINTKRICYNYKVGDKNELQI